MEPTTVAIEHVEVRDSASGPRAYIVGTRIRVEDVYVAHELRGWSPDRMVEAWPHVTLSQIHAALAHFYDHAEDIRERARAGREFAEEHARTAGPGLLAAKLQRLRPDADSVSP